MTAYQNDFFGNSHRVDPLLNVCIEKFREYCPVPPFPKTECYKIIQAEILSNLPKMGKAIRTILRAGDEGLAAGLIEAVLRDNDTPAPDTLPRAMREARKYLEKRNELVWADETSDKPQLDEMLVEIEESFSNIDSSLEARFHVALLEKFNGTKINWLRPGRVENFTVDFLSSIGAVSIELDGWEFHNDLIAFTKDRRKSRTMQRLGYTHLQYSGAELSVKGGIPRALEEIDGVLKWRMRTK